MENEILNQILSELKELKYGQAYLTDEVQGLKGDVQGLKGDVQELKGDVQGLKGDVQGLKGDVQGLKGDVQEIRERVILIENEHGKSLDALHDGYHLLYCVCQEIREDIRRLYAHQDRQDARIMLLDNEKRNSGDAV